MKNIYLKLAASVLSIVMALTMIVGATFAWFTFSTSPEVGGISIAIGGGRTIMVAPDLTETVEVDGEQVTVHYPGSFGSKLNFSEYKSYDYLKKIAGLSPVSTADGLYWMLPTYEEATGELKNYKEFEVDGTLQYANLEEANGGHYVYVDFWIVSPSKEFNIRVSTDAKKKEGSYLIELPKDEKTENETVALDDIPGMAEATARVGFLVNTESVGEETIKAYQESDTYVKQYGKLLGLYQEKGEKPQGEFQFSIYEPNADSHPSEFLIDGEYLITAPLSYNPYGTTISEENISDRLMVQGKNNWRTTSMLYTDFQKGQLDAYVKSGDFYKLTSALYDHAAEGVVSAEQLSQIMTAGAADDVMITTLASNTPQRIRMYLWLEGQDADCTNVSSVEAASFALNLEFAGADQ